MIAGEEAFSFAMGGERLIGVLHRAPAGARRGIIMVVGGPQYRVGGHRHYVKVARALAASGVHVLRYDYRGIGDSTGRFHGFEDLDADIRAGVDEMFTRVRGLDHVVLWGLCESASAIAFYARQDRRVAGAVLVNPYVTTAGGRARAELRYYYLSRLLNGAFWRRLRRGDVAIGKSVFGAARSVIRAVSGGGDVARITLDRDAGDQARNHQIRPPDRTDPLPLPDRMAAGLEAFDGHVLFLLSDHDLTASEFRDAAHGRRWRGVMNRTRTRRFVVHGADHTFSRPGTLERALAEVKAWLGTW